MLGPLPWTADVNRNILVAMDYFTKWSEVYPNPNQKATTVTEALLQNWISRFRTSLQLLSDQGRNFTSTVCKGLCQLLEMDKYTNNLFSPTIIRHSREIQSNYPEQSFQLHALRSGTPAPCDFLFRCPPDAPCSPDDNVQDLQARLEDVHEFARGLEEGGLVTAGESSKSSDMSYSKASSSDKEEELISASAPDSRDSKTVFSNGGLVGWLVGV
ncbi:hypothetical protein AVEN_130992-1 [Araneus ventricosus]|uniref:Integrase catalytic domain-containing protein n=1 Tax=Araneus ventricosus TaxID=182803 RepID=A0A4Y2E825_ARAVE|nr:hypothetical protein AVEN_130992-1 [Araneus ventricosus]